MKFGITQAFQCSYLPEQQEQLLAAIPPPEGLHSQHYDMLITLGFRRSGEQVYRPHCGACQACQAIRLPVRIFTPSKSQKRLLKRNADLRVVLSKTDKTEYYELYERYINSRHADGAMYPASKEQYQGFILNPWQQQWFLEVWHEQALIAVAVTDIVKNGLSALYTFFSPDYEQRSIGTYAILQQILLAQHHQLPYLYLGYQIDSCQKMNYKQKFLPHERFLHNNWHLITKKAG
jgi:leucyl-tRNA---protein transferase